MDIISVIVPVYKVEQYLDKCVQSIVDQTYTNLEIILVDDGSPDNCGAMCDAWAEKDSRVRVIHKENGGLSDARNAGMAVATGEYIAFVDSDDWVDERYIASMYAAIKEHGAQIAACGVRFVYSEADIAQEQEVASAVVHTAEEALETLIRGEGFRAVAWNKLYHHDLLQGETFPVGKYHEDEFFTYRIIAKAAILTLVGTDLYFYLQRSGGIMGSVSPKHLEALDAGAERLLFLKENFPRLYNKDKITFCIGCVNYYKMALRFEKVERKAGLKKICAYRSQIQITKADKQGLSTKSNLYLWCGRWCMPLFARLLLLKER